MIITKNSLSGTCVGFEEEIQASVQFLLSNLALRTVEADPYWPKWNSPWCYRSVLHRYFSLISYFKGEMDECQPGDFSALAKMVFPLTEEQI